MHGSSTQTRLSLRRNTNRPLAFILLLTTILLSLAALGVLASSGDRQPIFSTCVKKCIKVDCAQNTLPFHLRLLQWTCESNCDYKCQRQIARAAQQAGRKVHQYHGKWPFVRILGVQEPASVLFSVLNGLMHLKNWSMVRALPRSHPMRRWLSVFIVLGTWTWFCSAVFHVRDFPLTEKLDYFSAGFNVLYMLFLAIVRMLRLDTWEQTRKVALACAIPYVLHVAYLSLVRFDYGYNMAANAAVGLLSNVAWFVVAVQAHRNGQPFWWKPAVLMLAMDLAFSLEAFDFPPFFDTLDAHSLWHAATIPIVTHWYDYLVKDAKWDLHLEQLRKN
ncbi:Per1-like-domain-containing protein [Kickxella alabastrina]|uniref:Per1-like-domain-containing protein n=1 Tax=Kickxella alabastrina TaxID=61397 RepID=UPI0022204360|nr:Per1-like-domain-containing protein [Kickxella alabastrina]KAI7827255.1 Per1-like-domain-containing protein [Kickxella alabastrina]